MKPIKHKKTIYFLAIFIAGFFVLSNQFVIQYWLSKIHTDATVVNIAGKQRMISQKVSIYFIEKHFKGKSSIKIDSLFSVWSFYAEVLINGNKDLGIKACKNKKIVAKLEKSKMYIQFIAQFLHKDVQINSGDLEMITQNQNIFLLLVDDIVTDLEKESNQEVVSIIIIELILSIVFLLILILEYAFIFKPIFYFLYQQNQQLETENTKFKSIAWLHSHEIRKPLANIMGLVDLLRYEENTKKENQELLEHLVEETENLDDIIRQVVNKVNEIH